jgi:hypothetical protein
MGGGSAGGAAMGVELNTGWIGGTCASAASCNNPAFTATARCETSGFPGGFCTQACTLSGSTYICPDASPLGGADRITTTRCISANGTPTCAAECDFTLSPTGCRPGYACVTRQRFNQSTRTFKVCLPEPGQRWPGEPAPANDIGQACASSASCAHNVCLGTSGGMCSKAMCDFTGCPTGSACFGIGNGQTTCLPTCSTATQCRQSEGYTCNTQYGACLPGPTMTGGGSWNPAVGAGDCATAWGNGGSGLHRCDTVRDDYVVARKSARNVALCRNGMLVQNYRMGLGFAPTGDKQQEGDGKTPEGVFFVGLKNPNSSYYKSLLVTYPDEQDAVRGLSAGLITQAQKNAIDQALAACQAPPQTTQLGSWIMIHGSGSSSDWTLGCMALDNPDLDGVWAALDTRDTIIVLP